MENKVISAADIDTLINASKKIKQGETVFATLETHITGKDTGQPKIIKEVVKENKATKGQIMNFPSVVPIQGEGIKGKAFIETFGSPILETGSKKHFSIKRTFFKALDKIMSEANRFKLNFVHPIYEYDEFGRVYIVCEDKRHYLNKDRTCYITEDGIYGEIIFNKDGTVDLTYIDNAEAIHEPKFISFNYLYISPAAAKRGKQLINAEEERITYEFTENNNFSNENIIMQGNIIDLEAYRTSIEEEPRR